MDTKIQAIAQSIAQQHGHAIFSAGEALKIAGLGGADPANVARQLIYRGRYPFRFAKIGGRNCVTAVDIAAAFVMDTRDDNPGAALKRGPGRPRKIAGGAA